MITRKDVLFLKCKLDQSPNNGKLLTFTIGNNKTIRPKSIFIAVGPRHTQYFCTQYCDKKIFFNQYFFHRLNWKYLFLDTYVPQMSMDTRKSSLMPVLWKDFEIQLQYFDKKMSFNLFIAISFYLNIVCKNILCDALRI